MRPVHNMTRSSGSAITDFEEWVPLLRDANAETLAYPDSHLQGMIAVHSHSVPTGYGSVPAEVRGREKLAVDPLRALLRPAGLESVSFKAQFTPDGHATLTLTLCPQQPGRVMTDGSVTLIADSLPDPYRRRPVPRPGAVSHSSADPATVQRLVRETFPALTPATAEEIAAAEARIGMPLPEELKALYQVTRGPAYADPGAAWPAEFGKKSDDGEDGSGWSATGILWEIPLPIEKVRLVDPTLRYLSWEFGARDVAVTLPGAAVQQAAGSPGWILFGDDHGARYYAIDLAPGEGGHAGQVIGLSIDESIGATLMARSLAAFLQGDEADDVDTRAAEELAAATIFEGGQYAVDATARPELEVLILSSYRDMEPVSLAAFASLPRLRTLIATPGVLADPLEVADLEHLEYLELSAEDWRCVIDAGAFPPNLQAARVHRPLGNPVPQPQPDFLPRTLIANELAARWNRPQLTVATIEGDLA